MIMPNTIQIEGYPAARVDLEKPCPSCGRPMLDHCVGVAMDVASPWGSVRDSDGYPAFPDSITCRESMIKARRLLSPEAWARIGYTISDGEAFRFLREDLLSCIRKDLGLSGACA